MKTWRDLNPGWDYQLWDNRRLAEHPFALRDQIEASPRFAGKADIMRYEILHTFGGFFIDADSECVLPLPDDLLANDSFACYENERVTGDLIANGYLGAGPGNRLMEALMDRIRIKEIGKVKPWRETGPGFLTETVADLTYTDLRVYPAKMFIPVHHTGRAAEGDCPTYARQYWGTTHGYHRAWKKPHGTIQ